MVSSASWSAAGQLQQMVYNYLNQGSGFTETRQYNTNLQLTRLTATPYAGSGIDLEYRYGPTGTATNGRLWQVKDWVSGEEVTYQYDALNRLTQAITTDPNGWGQSFVYDGFGNLTQQIKSAQRPGGPNSWTLTVNGVTNRITDAGYQYDLNGNLTASPGAAFTYDVANRVISNGAAYDPNNRRVWDGSRIYFYAPNGQWLASYQPNFAPTFSTFTRLNVNVWFGGKLIRQNGNWVMTDRLGSVRANGAGERFNYYPYGTEIQPTADLRTKFATYHRDSAGVDYANQRYYANATGRFQTPDPAGIAGADPAHPASWNRYA